MTLSCEAFRDEVDGALEAWGEELTQGDHPRSSALRSRLSNEARDHLEGCTDCQKYLSSKTEEN